jgi:hypothetical protein
MVTVFMAAPLGWLIMATPKHLPATKRLVFSTRPVVAHFFVPVDVAGRVDDARGVRDQDDAAAASSQVAGRNGG